MRVVEFHLAQDPVAGPARVGIVDDGGVQELAAAPGADGLRDLLASGADIGSVTTHDRHSLEAIEYVPLLASTGRVFAAGLNYEKKYPAGKQPPTPTHPPWFSKMPGTLVGHEQPVVAPVVHESFDYEAELAAVIGAVSYTHLTLPTKA